MAQALIQAARIVPVTLAENKAGATKTTSLRARAGIHSGPIIGTILNQHAPRYSLVGESVNTSARLEFHALRERIQCSEDTYNIAIAQDPSLDFSTGSLMNIKGRQNAMPKFWLTVEAKKMTHGILTSQELLRKFALLDV